MKLTKWEAYAFKGKLVRFNNHIIYKIYIKDQNKIIQIKHLKLFKDIIFHIIILLLDFDGKPIFN